MKDTHRPSQAIRELLNPHGEVQDRDVLRFVSAILGKPIPIALADERAQREYVEWLDQCFPGHKLQSGELQNTGWEARKQREQLEWLAQFSTDHAAQLRALRREEEAARNGRAGADWLGELRCDESWDPSKHPRRGGPPNAGWFASKGSTASGQSPKGTSKPIDASPIRRVGTAKTFASPGQGLDRQERGAGAKSSKFSTVSQKKAKDAPNEDASKRELTEDDVLMYFELFYGDKGRKLLDAYKEAGGVLQFENLWFGNSNLDTLTYSHPTRIRLHKDLNPAEAAQELMARLLDASALQYVRKHLDHTGFANIEILIDSYRQAFRESAKTAALAAELYLSGISIVSEGADWVITINELSEGNYYAALGFLPLLPAAVGKTGIVLKHGRQTIKIPMSAARRVKALPVDELIELLESTRRLARNMEKAGIKRPSGTAAHHIVPAGVMRFKSAVEARKILERFKIDVASAANGVYLPSEFDEAVKAAYHGSVHTKRYFDEVLNRLKKARSPEDALVILNQIRKELLNGTFPQ